MRRDYTGTVSGRLTMLECVGVDAHSSALWKCICQCGKERIAVGTKVAAGVVRSCGCLRTEKALEALKIGQENRKIGYALAAKRSILQAYRSGAKGRGFDFCLTEDEFFNLIAGDCAYCGSAPTAYDRYYRVRCAQNKGKPADKRYIIRANGVDRVDSEIGYSVENCAPCCETCNRMKMALPRDVFLSQVDKIFRHNNERLETT